MSHVLSLSTATSKARREGGFSLVEAMIGIAIIGMALGATMTLNGQQLRLVKATRDGNAATLFQQERVEQLRQLRWPDLTSATYIANTYMPRRPNSRQALNLITERITVSAYPSPTAGSRPLSVFQGVNGAVTVDSQKNGFSLGSERLVRVDMEISWVAADGHAQRRETSTLISNSGVTRSNLPALGPISGGPYAAFSTPTPVTATPVPVTATPVPVTATPVPVTATPSPGVGMGSGQGAEHGRGNTGGHDGRG